MKHKTINKQKGFTLIELMVVIVIIGVLSAYAASYQKRDIEKQVSSIAAEHLSKIAKASNAYIRDNYSAIMSLATSTQPAIIRVSDLISQNYLPPGTSTNNAYQQSTCALVLQPSPGQLTGMVVTEGGKALDDFTLSSMVTKVGAAGGGIYTDTPAAIIGSRGGWSVSHANYSNANHLGQDCSGNAGTVDMDVGHAHVALWFENNDLTAGFLYREEIPGRPELNRMATNLDMAGNELTGASKVEATDSFDMNGTSVIDSSRNLVNIDSIFASGNVEVTGKLEANTIKPTLVVSAGSACSENSAIATDASGQLLSCQSGSWQGVAGGISYKNPLTYYATNNLMTISTEDINNNSWRSFTFGAQGTALNYTGENIGTLYLRFAWATGSCDPSGSVYLRLYRNGSLIYTSPQIHDNGQSGAINFTLNHGDYVSGTWYAGTNSCRPHLWGERPQIQGTSSSIARYIGVQYLDSVPLFGWILK